MTVLVIRMLMFTMFCCFNDDGVGDAGDNDVLKKPQK